MLSRTVSLDRVPAQYVSRRSVWTASTVDSLGVIGQYVAFTGPLHGSLFSAAMGRGPSSGDGETCLKAASAAAGVAAPEERERDGVVHPSGARKAVFTHPAHRKSGNGKPTWRGP